jgi:DtxR family transcriptional regulator, Mn-dependent transcriptional regulator
VGSRSCTEQGFSLASTGQHESAGGLGRAGEDYLRAIYKIHARGARATTSAIADQVGVSSPSATAMVAKLSGIGLTSRERYGSVDLTARGRRVALELTRHHRLLELFLVERLGVPISEAHREADRLEHALSEEVETRIAASLGDPRSDPHGDPIPPA